MQNTSDLQIDIHFQKGSTKSVHSNRKVDKECSKNFVYSKHNRKIIT
jgi:hypothetical protein